LSFTIDSSEGRSIYCKQKAIDDIISGRKAGGNEQDRRSDNRQHETIKAGINVVGRNKSSPRGTTVISHGKFDVIQGFKPTFPFEAQPGDLSI
jgi:hypothetical protein